MRQVLYLPPTYFHLQETRLRLARTFCQYRRTAFMSLPE